MIVALQISESFIRRRMMIPAAILALVSLGLIGFMLDQYVRQTTPEVTLGQVIFVALLLPPILAAALYWGYRRAPRHAVVLDPTTVCCTSSVLMAVTYSIDDPLVLGLDARGRYWLLSVRTRPERKMRVSVAAWPGLPSFLKQHCLHLVSEVPPATSD